MILRNRLRRDGYNPQTDEVNDTLQAIRLVRAHAKEWNLDPNKIGIMGFSAGAELAAAAAVLYDEFDKKNSGAGDPLAGVSSRPDFAGIIYPGPSPFAPQPHGSADSARRAARLPGLRRIGRPGSRRVGDRVLLRDAGARACRTSRCTCMARAGIPARRCPTAAT